MRQDRESTRGRGTLLLLAALAVAGFSPAGPLADSGIASAAAADESPPIVEVAERPPLVFLTPIPEGGLPPPPPGTPLAVSGPVATLLPLGEAPARGAGVASGPLVMLVPIG